VECRALQFHHLLSSTKLISVALYQAELRTQFKKLKKIYKSNSIKPQSKQKQEKQEEQEKKIIIHSVFS